MAYMTKVAQIAQRALAQRAKDNEEIDNLRSKLMISAMQTKFKNEYAARKLQEQRAYDLKKSVRDKRISAAFEQAKENRKRNRPLDQFEQSNLRSSIGNMFNSGQLKKNNPFVVSSKNPDFVFTQGHLDSWEGLLKNRQSKKQLGIHIGNQKTEEIQKIFKKYRTDSLVGVDKLDSFGRSSGKRTARDMLTNVDRFYRQYAKEISERGLMDGSELEIREHLRKKYPDPFSYGQAYSKGYGLRIKANKTGSDQYHLGSGKHLVTDQSVVKEGDRVVSIGPQSLYKNLRSQFHKFHQRLGVYKGTTKGKKGLPITAQNKLKKEMRMLWVSIQRSNMDIDDKGFLRIYINSSLDRMSKGLPPLEKDLGIYRTRQDKDRDGRSKSSYMVTADEQWLEGPKGRSDQELGKKFEWPSRWEGR